MTPAATCEVMPRVYNKRHNDAPPDAVYVGRPSSWGNPFHIGRDGSRAEVLAKYEGWIAGRPELFRPLRGKSLVCWCAPQPCHADVLLRLANSEEARG